MESVIQNSTQEIGNPANDWNPESNFYCQGNSTVKESVIQCLESGIRSVESTIQPAPLINSYHVYCYFLWQ